MAPKARLRTNIERLKDRLRCRHPSRDVADGNPDADRAEVVAGHARQAAFRLHQQIVGLQFVKRPLVAVTGNRTGDQPGIFLSQLRHREAEPIDRAGRQILNEDISAADHLAENGAVMFLLQVEADRFLAAVEPDEIGALTMHQVVVLAGEIAFGPFDLDDARAAVRELAGEIGGSNSLFYGNNQQSVEIRSHYSHLFGASRFQDRSSIADSGRQFK